MTIKSNQAYYDNQDKFPVIGERVLEIVKGNPRITGDQIAKMLSKKFSEISGRLTEHRRDGKVYILDGEGRYSQYVYERDPERQKELAKIYEREKTVRDFKNFLAKYGHKLTESGRVAIRATYERISQDLTVEEQIDLLTESML